LEMLNSSKRAEGKKTSRSGTLKKIMSEKPNCRQKDVGGEILNNLSRLTQGNLNRKDEQGRGEGIKHTTYEQSKILRRSEEKTRGTTPEGIGGPGLRHFLEPTRGRREKKK